MFSQTSTTVPQTRAKMEDDVIPIYKELGSNAFALVFLEEKDVKIQLILVRK